MARSQALKVACVAAGMLVAWTVAAVLAAPAPAGKSSDKWEYGEVHHRTVTARNAAGGRGGPGGAGGAGGANGAAVPAKAARTTTIRWIASEQEVEANGWEDLGTKLKAPAGKKGATDDAHRMRVLNHLGSQGWEMVSSHKPEVTSGASVWTFKRRVR